MKKENVKSQKKKTSKKKTAVSKGKTKVSVKKQIEKVELNKKKAVSRLKNKLKEDEIKIEKKDNVISKLRKEIRESEKVLNNEKNVRKTGTIAFLIFCFVVILISITLIDYSNSSLQKKVPNFVLKVENKNKQMVTYYGLFYKVLKCNSEDNLLFATYNTKDPECSYEISYEDGFYTNPNGIKISEQQIEIMIRYYRDLLNSWTKEKELNDAYKLSIEFNKIWWIKKEVNIPLSDGNNASIAVFNKLEMEDGIYKWKPQYSDEKYQKCVKLDSNGKNLFATYSNGVCSNDWEQLKLNSEACELIKSDKSFMRNTIMMNKLCE